MIPKISITDLKFYTREYYRLIGKKSLLYFGSTIIPAVLDGIGITMIVPLLNVAIKPETAGMIPADTDGNNHNFAYKLLSWFNIGISLENVLLFIAGLYVFKFLISYSNSIFRSYLISLVLKKVRLLLYRQITDMEYGAFQKHNTGFYSNLAGVQVGHYVGGFAYLSVFYTVTISAISYLFISVFIDWKFSILAGLTGLVFVVLFSSLSKKVKSLSMKNTENEKRTTAFFIETVQSNKYLKATGAHKSFIARLQNEIEHIRRQTFKSERLRGFFLSVNEPLIIFLICFFIFLQIRLLGHEFSSMLLSVYLFHRALTHIMVTQKEWQFIMNISGGIHAVAEQLKFSVANREKSGTTKINPPIEHIEFKNVTFRYGEEAALRNINLHIRKNTTVAFVGQSGAGKTTLTDLITLLYKPQEGIININGISSKDVDLISYRENVGLVTQDVHLFDDTIANNITLFTEAQPEQLKQVLQDAYASEFIDNLPEGIETRVGDRGFRLSGGQKQRLSLARELYKKPSLLILDEATSALDSESESFIKDTIDKLKGKHTIIMIAHRLSTVKEADHIVVLKDGAIQDIGSFTELVERDEYFRKLVTLQQL